MPADAGRGGRPLVLVVDDDEGFVEALVVGLHAEGFDVEVACDGVEAVECFEASPPDLILLDVMLPRMSGLDVCRRIRARSGVPIIFLSARSSELDAVLGLEVGADDYVAKPYRARELVARMRAVLRRGPSPSGAAVPEEVIRVGDVVLDPGRHEVRVGDRPVPLPLKEFELLGLLLANAGRVLPRHLLISRVWGGLYGGDTKTLDVHIKRLRAKLEEDPRRPRHITTVRGVGYRFELPSGR